MWFLFLLITSYFLKIKRIDSNIFKNYFQEKILENKNQTYTKIFQINNLDLF